MKSNSLISKKLFISRQLGADSIFHQLGEKGWKIIDQSLLLIEYIKVDNIPDSDWIFFYSPNGVKAFIENVKSLNYNIESFKIAAYGSGTAETLYSFNLRVDFVGTGEALGTFQKFNKIAGSSKVLFPKATHSKHALLAYGKYSFTPIDLVVYENTMNPTDIPACDVYIFTSSLNVKSFFILNKIQSDAQVLAIGQPTAATLAEYFPGEIKIPATPGETDLFKLVI